VKGYFGQFRRIYSTTSSLSYAFPPKTTIIGLIAGILGFERDSYYEIFSSKNCQVGLQIRTPVRRIAHTINYLNTDMVSIKTFRGIVAPAPVVNEIILKEDKNFEQLCYRIFFTHKNEKIMKELKNRLYNKEFFYPPSLGQANNLADLEYISSIFAEIFEPKGDIDILTVIPKSLIISIQPMEGVKIYIEEKVPAEFSTDRTCSKTETYVYEWTGKPLRVQLNGEVFSCILEGKKIFGTFM
jgi:CRISPR-associated protein Cas5h